MDQKGYLSFRKEDESSFACTPR